MEKMSRILPEAGTRLIQVQLDDKVVRWQGNDILVDLFNRETLAENLPANWMRFSRLTGQFDQQEVTLLLMNDDENNLFLLVNPSDEEMEALVHQGWFAGTIASRSLTQNHKLQIRNHEVTFQRPDLEKAVWRALIEVRADRARVKTA